VVTHDNKPEIAAAVEEVYAFIEQAGVAAGASCLGCGNCCKFKEYDHRLYISTPELIYLESQIGKLKWAGEMVCPWHDQGRCGIHNYRFAGCRIFFCKGDSAQQGQLSEEVLTRLKAICNQFSIPYEYKELSAALDERKH